MKQRKISEMSRLERFRHSLQGRTIQGILIFSLSISLIASVFVSFLFVGATLREYRMRTWQMSRDAAEVLDKEAVRRQAELVIGIYDSLSEEERDLLASKSVFLLSRFDAVRKDKAFESVCATLREIQQGGDGIAAFTAFLDPKTNRRVFITDSDPGDSFCPPGSWDEYPANAIHNLLYGKEQIIDRFLGGEKIPATSIRLKAYGYRCTAGTQLFEIRGYPVLVMYDTDMNQVIRTSQHFVLQYLICQTLLTAAAIVVAQRHIRKSVTDPINELADAAKDYITDRDDGQLDEKHFGKLEIRTGDEIEALATAMQSMEDDLEEYIRNLTAVTAEKERIGAELSLAARIQEAMLPHIFPPFPDRPEFDLYASMDPAKEVGGDFYDFYLIDDDHLGLVIADVSGKGVPGALFMTVSKSILQSCAMLGQSPAEILAKTNEGISSNNEAEMFVTVWIGILEISTGRLTAANAGHEYPVLKKADGSFELFKDRHGFVIGGMEGVRYREYELQLEPGDVLFTYTDGVPEAVNTELELFGTERMIAVLNEEQETDPESILKNVSRAVDRFVGDAEQFDDITMLCLRYNGKDPEQKPGEQGREPT